MTAREGFPPRAATYQLSQYRFTLSCDAEAVAGLFAELLEGFRAGTSVGDGAVDSYVLRFENGLIRMHFDGNEVVPALPLPSAVDKILREVSSAGINKTTSHLAVHAGAVSRAGVGAMLPAASGSGKSTTVAALVQAGCDYLSDEAAMIDLGSGDLQPYARPLALSTGSVELLAPLATTLPIEIDWRDLTEWHVAPRQLRPASIGERAPLRAMFFPRFERDAAMRCEPMARSDALVEVIRNSFNFARFGAAGLEALAGVVRRSRAYRLVFGDVHRAAAQIVAILDDTGAQAAGSGGG